MEFRLEKMTSGRGGRTEGAKYLKFMKSWIQSGCPSSFKTDGNFERIWDMEAYRENIRDRLNPELRMLKLRRAKLELERMNRY